jgi:hypothetical protein
MPDAALARRSGIQGMFGRLPDSGFALARAPE